MVLIKTTASFSSFPLRDFQSAALGRGSRRELAVSLSWSGVDQAGLGAHWGDSSHKRAPEQTVETKNELTHLKLED